MPGSEGGRAEKDQPQAGTSPPGRPYMHLSNIFAKLGVSSRTETAAAVIRGQLPVHLAGG